MEINSIGAMQIDKTRPPVSPSLLLQEFAEVAENLHRNFNYNLVVFGSKYIL